MRKDEKIFVAGHRGLVGSAIRRKLEAEGYTNLILKTRAELDLTRQAEVETFFDAERPEYLFLAAAKVGGIWGNKTYPADFIYTNLVIQTNLIHTAWRYGVKRLLFLGSSCIYPRLAPQPMEEAHLMTGPLEPTNSPYATAKIAGIEMCWSYNRQHGTRFIPVMPTNLYGPNDNFNLETSHVLPALVRKFHLAKMALTGNWQAVARDESRFGPIPPDIREAIGYSPSDDHGKKPAFVKLWGTGSPRREFLHVHDLADACLFVMNQPDEALFSGELTPANVLFNIGVGDDVTIRELAEMVADAVGYDGEVIWDAKKPDGTPRKLLDVSRMTALGWRASIDLADGVRNVYAWYLAEVGE